MATCRNCNKEISKLDNDMCPYCGCKNPIDSNYKTMDITRNISKQDSSYELYKSKKKAVYVTLSALLGVFGIDQFYIGYIKKGFNKLFLFILVVGAIGLVLFFLTELSYISFVVPAAVIYLINFIYTLLILTAKDSIKDSSGEYLR